MWATTFAPQFARLPSNLFWALPFHKEVRSMFERDEADRHLSAGDYLALHADHRRGLHATPHPDCTQCTFDSLDDVANEQSAAPMPAEGEA
jgi:hypothetical protein